MMLIAVVLLSLSLASCDLFGQQTTAVTTEPIIVDTENFIEIDTVQALQEMEMNLSYKLVADLDLTGIEWKPLGDYDLPFMGIFDGNGYTISNMTITEDNQIFVGLFGNVTGDILDLQLTNVSIDCDTDFLTYVGGLVGFTTGNVTNVSVSGDITVLNSVSNTYMGLLVGYTQSPLEASTDAASFVSNTLENNDVEGTLTLTSENIAFIGGLAGKTFNTMVKDNYANTDIQLTTANFQSYLGGFIGHNYGGILEGHDAEVEDVNIYIENNVAISDIQITVDEKNISFGGFIGYNNFGYLRNNYAKSQSSVTATTSDTQIFSIGAFLGENWDSQIVGNVAIYAYASNLYTLIDGTGYTVNTDNIFIGLNKSTLDFTDNYLANLDKTIDTSQVSGLTVLSPSEFNASTFYSTTLGWRQSQIDKILD